MAFVASCVALISRRLGRLEVLGVLESACAEYARLEHVCPRILRAPEVEALRPSVVGALPLTEDRRSSVQALFFNLMRIRCVLWI